MTQLFLTFRSEDDTNAFAQKIAPLLKTGDCLILQGDLGAGKSTFARALIREWSHTETMDVPSPTFTLVQHYQNQQEQRLDHYDAYRIEEENEIIEVGLEDSLENAITLIEWPEKIASYLPDRLYRLIFKIADDGVTRKACLIADDDFLKKLEKTA